MQFPSPTPNTRHVATGCTLHTTRYALTTGCTMHTTRYVLATHSLQVYCAGFTEWMSQLVAVLLTQTSVCPVGFKACTGSACAVAAALIFLARFNQPSQQAGSRFGEFLVVRSDGSGILSSATRATSSLQPLPSVLSVIHGVPVATDTSSSEPRAVVERLTG